MATCLNFSRKEVEDPGYIARELALAYPEFEILPRHSFKLAKSLVPPTQRRTKKTTVRYTCKAVEYPAEPALPMLAPKRKPDDFASVGCAQVIALTYKPFMLLNTIDAMRDGFENGAKLKAALVEFYGPIGDDEPVCIFTFAYEAIGVADAKAPPD